MRTVVRNITWLLLSQTTTWTMSIALLVVAPRLLGEADFGRLFVAVTFVGFFEIAANLGTATYLTKVIARDPAIAGHYVVNLTLAKFVWSVVLGGGSVVSAIVLNYDRTLVLLIGVNAAAMVLTTLYGSISSGLNGLQKMGGLAIGAVFAKLAYTVLGLVVLAAGWGVIWYAAAGIVSIFIQVVFCAYEFRTQVHGPIRIEPAVIKEAVVGGIPFGLASTIIMLYGKIDVPLLERLSDAATVGSYSVAYQWVSMPAFFAMTVMSAVFPSLSAHGASLGPQFAAMTNKALRLVFAVGAPVACGVALIASDGIRIVYGGGKFHQAVPVTAILSTQIPIVGVTIILSAAIAASDRQREWLVVGLSAVIVNIGLNIVAIPWSVRTFDNGAIGAAIVTVATEVAVMIGGYLLRAPGVLDKATLGFMFRCTAATAAMIPMVLVFGQTLALKIVLGFVVFALMSFLFGVVTPREIRQGMQQVRRSVGRDT